MKWNPLTSIIKTHEYKLSLRTSAGFYKRIEQTFHLFFGSFYGSKKNKAHFGLLDYIYPLARVSEVPLNLFHADGTETKTTIIAALLSAAIAFIFNIPKLVAAATLTFLALPFIGLAHAFISFKAKNLNQKISSLKINENLTPCTVWIQRPQLFAKSTSLRFTFNDDLIQNLIIRPVFLSFITEDSHQKIVVSMDDEENAEACLGLFDKRNTTSLTYPGGSLLGIIKLTPGNLPALESIFKLNKFRATEILSLTNTFTCVSNKLKESKLHASQSKHIRQAFCAGLSKSYNNTSTLKTLTNAPCFDKNILNLIFFYSRSANT